jgi:GT2 family glycosyltransferase
MSDMKIAVVIPIVHDKFIHPLLDCISSNTVQPDLIIIVDNSEKKFKFDNTHLQIRVFRPVTPLYINASWNFGISECVNHFDLITILNDDLLIEELFFEKLNRLAELHVAAGVFCPETLSEALMVSKPKPAISVSCVSMRKREGWAWTIRSTVAKLIPSIPEELKTWCGDDWYWYHCHKLGYPWLKMNNNTCFHYVGQSNKIMDVRKDLHAEKAIFRSCL